MANSNIYLIKNLFRSFITNNDIHGNHSITFDDLYSRIECERTSLLTNLWAIDDIYMYMHDICESRWSLLSSRIENDFLFTEISIETNKLEVFLLIFFIIIIIYLLE